MKLWKTVDGALRILGVLGAGETASPTEHKEALETLSLVIESLNTEGLLIPIRQEQAIQLSAGETWGNPTIFGITPITVDSVFFRDTSGVDYILTPFGLNDWVNIPIKGITGTPQHYHAEIGDRTTTIYLDYVPPPDWVLHIIGKMPFTGEHTDPNEDIEWDYGYELMLRYLLAIELAPAYGVPLTQELLFLANQKKSAIKTKNAKNYKLTFDRGLSGGAKNTSGFFYTKG